MEPEQPGAVFVACRRKGKLHLGHRPGKIYHRRNDGVVCRGVGRVPVRAFIGITVAVYFGINGGRNFRSRFIIGLASKRGSRNGRVAVDILDVHLKVELVVP